MKLYQFNKICDLFQSSKHHSSKLLLSKFAIWGKNIPEKNLNEIIDKFENISTYLQMLDLPWISQNLNDVRVRQTVVNIAIISDGNAYEKIMLFLSTIFQKYNKMTTLDESHKNQ